MLRQKRSIALGVNRARLSCASAAESCPCGRVGELDEVEAAGGIERWREMPAAARRCRPWCRRRIESRRGALRSSPKADQEKCRDEAQLPEDEPVEEIQRCEGAEESGLKEEDEREVERAFCGFGQEAAMDISTTIAVSNSIRRPKSVDADVVAHAQSPASRRGLLQIGGRPGRVETMPDDQRQTRAQQAEGNAMRRASLPVCSPRAEDCKRADQRHSSEYCDPGKCSRELRSSGASARSGIAASPIRRRRRCGDSFGRGRFEGARRAVLLRLRFDSLDQSQRSPRVSSERRPCQPEYKKATSCTAPPQTHGRASRRSMRHHVLKRMTVAS